jgi:hypothetical protein
MINFLSNVFASIINIVLFGSWFGAMEVVLGANNQYSSSE